MPPRQRQQPDAAAHIPKSAADGNLPQAIITRFAPQNAHHLQSNHNPLPATATVESLLVAPLAAHIYGRAGTAAEAYGWLYNVYGARLYAARHLRLSLAAPTPSCH